MKKKSNLTIKNIKKNLNKNLNNYLFFETKDNKTYFRLHKNFIQKVTPATQEAYLMMFKNCKQLKKILKGQDVTFKNAYLNITNNLEIVWYKLN